LYNESFYVENSSELLELLFLAHLLAVEDEEYEEEDNDEIIGLLNNYVLPLYF